MKLIKALQMSAALSVAAISAPAFAAVNFDVVNGEGTFSHAQIGAGKFDDTFSFSTSTVLESVNLSYFAKKISSLTATLNGDNITFAKQADGSYYGSLTTSLSAGVQTLIVSGFASAKGASYSGNLTSSAVPEPASWALMIVGMGVAGTMRRRRRNSAALTA